MLKDYFIKGGIFMWPLLLCSVISIAIVFERFFYFFKIKRERKRFWEKILPLIKDGLFYSAAETVKNINSPFANVIKAGLKKIKESPDVIREAFEHSQLEETPKIERYLPVLATISSISTLLGISGTVTGMIRAFSDIVKAGVTTPAIVAKGVYEALITTAYGLMIAVPTLIFYYYFAHKANMEINEIEISTREVLSYRK